MPPQLSPLVRGLSRLLEKGNWTYWLGDGTSYDFTPKDSFDYRVILSRFDDTVSVIVGGRYDGGVAITKEEQAHLREVCLRVYLRPAVELERKRKLEEEAAERIRVRRLRETLEELGAE